MTNEIAPHTENSKLTIYVGDPVYIFDVRGGMKGSPPPIKDKPILTIAIFDEKYSPNFQDMNIDDIIDYFVNRKTIWESLPEQVPISMNRQDLRDYQDREIDKGYFLLPQYNMSWIFVFSHHQPIVPFGSSGFSYFHLNDVYLPDGEPAFNTMIINNHTPNIGRPVVEYGALEYFCENYIGPSMRKGFFQENKDIVYGRRSLEFLDSKTEESAEKVIRRLNKDRSYRLKYLWNGLNILYPDFQERMERIRKFNERWFPEEIILGRKTYEDSRVWLQSLKG